MGGGARRGGCREEEELDEAALGAEEENEGVAVAAAGDDVEVLAIELAFECRFDPDRATTPPPALPEQPAGTFNSHLV